MVMNEKTEAEKIIDGKPNGNKTSDIILILAKYYTQIKNENNNRTYELIVENLLNIFPCFDVYEWSEFIKKVIKNSKKYPIKEVDKVPVTQKEIDVIKSIPVKRLQKLAFTYLVVGKYNYLVNGNGWVNVSYDAIMKMAGIHWTNNLKRCYDVHELYVMKLLSVSKKIDDIKVKIEFIDINGEEVIGIRTFNKLGWFWDRYLKNEVKICVDCGEFFEVKGKSRRSKIRCDECQHEINKKCWKTSKQKSRKMSNN